MCIVGVLFGCLSVVPTTVVLENATPDSKENKQADASTRLFSKVLSAARCCEIVRQQNVKVYLHIHVQRECSAIPFMPSIVCHQGSSHLSPVLAYDLLSRYKFSTLTSAPLYSNINRLFAQNPVFEIVHQESVKKVYLHIHVQRECSAIPFMRTIMCP